MDIRLGTLQQADDVSKLIFASEPTLLSFLFGGDAKCLAYLQLACAQTQGQFSANYHWVALHHHKHNKQTTQAEPVVSGICATWLSIMPKDFQQDTVSALREFLDLEQIIHLLAYQEALDSCFVPPKHHQLCIGHMSIDIHYQRLGIATSLIEHAKLEAARRGKSELILDVDVMNESAICCYEKSGFTHQREREFEATKQRFSRMSCTL